MPFKATVPIAQPQRCDTTCKGADRDVVIYPLREIFA